MLTSKLLGTILFIFAVAFYFGHSYFENKMMLFISCMCVLFGWASFYTMQPNPEYLQGKCVLIISCDSSLHFALANHLLSLGMHVFATFHDLHSPAAVKLQTLFSNSQSESTDSSLPRLTCFEVDPTSDSEVSNLAFVVKGTLQSKGMSLYALVHSGEGFHQGSVVAIPSTQYLRMFELNFFTPLRVTSAFLPLLIPSQGRILHISNQHGRVVYPGRAAESTSRFATEVLMDALRRELGSSSGRPDPFDVKVIQVEFCASELTPTDDASAQLVSSDLDDQRQTVLRQYLGLSKDWPSPEWDKENVANNNAIIGQVLLNALDNLQHSSVASRDKPENNSETLEVALATLTDCLGADNPKDRYVISNRVGWRHWAKWEAVASSFLPATLMDMWMQSNYNIY